MTYKVNPKIKKIGKKLSKQSDAREEFYTFFREWVEKYEFPMEVYRDISFLMIVYVMNYMEE
jgi:hypothetical protein